MTTDADRQERLAVDALDGVELVLPSGATIRCRPLTLAQAVHYLRALQRVQDGDVEMMLEVIETFPKDVGGDDDPAILEAFDRELGQPPDFFAAVQRFLSARRSSRKTDLATVPESPQPSDSPRLSVSTS